MNFKLKFVVTTLVVSATLLLNHSVWAIETKEEKEFILKDMEQKLLRLQEAKRDYDEARLKAEGVLKKIEKERRLYQESLQNEKNIQTARVQASITLLTQMDPPKAGHLLEVLDRDLVIVLMSQMPADKVTRILENVSPTKATQFLEYYTRLHSGQGSDMLKNLGLCSTAKEENESLKKHERSL